MWSVAVAFGYVLGITLGLGIIGMWWAFVLDENIRGILFSIRWRSKKWQTKGFVNN